jgi:5-methylcytosine-specific restriction endonuclease McrA
MRGSALNHPVLLLNKGWTAIRVITVREAFEALCADTCRGLDNETSTLYSWDKWIDLPVEGHEYVQATHGLMVRAPRIVILKEYNKIPRTSVRLSRKNVWTRDQGRCQYSGKAIPLKDATLDHIIPESRGGRTTWTNLVTCCQEINHRKGNRTPEEAGLVLLSTPKKPFWSPVYSSVRHFENIPEEWIPYLPNERQMA